MSISHESPNEVNTHKNKPGTILMHYFRARNIKPTSGCSCYPLAEKMDNRGPEEVLENIENWTDDMVLSAKEWRKGSTGGWLRFIVPPRIVVKHLIVWACNESMAP